MRAPEQIAFFLECDRRDAWLLDLWINEAGRLADSHDPVGRYQLRAYVDFLPEYLEGKDTLRRVLLEIERDPDNRVMTPFRRAREIADEIRAGLRPWPSVLKAYKTFRELTYFHGKGDYPPPHWPDAPMTENDLRDATRAAAWSRPKRKRKAPQ